MPALSEAARSYELWLGNIEELRAELNDVIAPQGSPNWRIPMMWSILIK